MSHSIIPKLHAAWNRATGQNLPMGVCSYELEHGYHQFLKAGYSEPEMLLVVNYLQAEIRKGNRKPAALRWRNCIGDVLRFAEELELARGAQRNKKPETPIARAMRQLRPVAADVTPNDHKPTAVPVGDLIANLKRAAGMAL
jgi:hypothetical protein